MHVPLFLFDWFEQSSYLLAQFRIVCVPVTGDGVINGGFQDFILGALEP
jgi:hypothetical protein